MREEENERLRLCLVHLKYFSEKCYLRERKIFSSVWLHYENCSRKYFHVFGNILKMLFSTTTHTKPTTTQQENHQNTTTHTTTKKKNQRSKACAFVGRSKSHRKSKSHRERDRFMALGRRRRVEDRFVARRFWVIGEVEGSWVEGSGSKIGLWVHRLAKLKA